MLIIIVGGSNKGYGVIRTYKIETERLIIRCYEPTDAALLLDAITISIDHLQKWLPWAKGEPSSFESKIKLLRQFRKQFDLGINYVYGIFDKEERELIGSTGLHTRLEKTAREIGYWISIKHINNGFALEAVSALTRVGFDIEKLSRIEIYCDPENVRSQNIPRKLCYKLEATLKNKRNQSSRKSQGHYDMDNV